MSGAHQDEFQNESRKLRTGFFEESSFLRFYVWKYKKWIGIGLLALVFVDLIDVIPPILLKNVVDIAVAKGPVGSLVHFALVYLGIAIVQGFCRYLWRMYLIRSSIFAGRDLRGKYAKHLFSLSSSFFDRHRMGDLMSHATNDVESIRIALGSGILVFADAVFYILTVPVAMWFLSPQLTVLCCLPLPLIPWLVLRNEKAIHHRFEKVQDCFGRISAMAQENLNGARVIKAFAQEDTQYQRLKALGEEYIQLNLSLARIQSTTGPLMDFVMSIGLVTLLFWGGWSMIQHGETLLTLGTFVAFQRYIQKMIWPMAALGMSANYYQKAISSSNRMKKIFAAQSDVPEPSTSVVGRAVMGTTRGAVEFKNLYFSYPGTEARILKGINLRIEPGERLALVGGIASGKSTALGLLPRLYPVAPGMLSIDGIDINHWPLEELRRQVGYVSQEVYLFSESVYENVAFGLHRWVEGGFSREGQVSVIEESARFAAVHDEITNLEGSYGTRLGERGTSLSGGQKQRLTIARALAKKPAILVLDDALASVDVHTEEKILTALRSRSHRNTEIIAAHRISTVKDADRIVVLHEGQISQMGTHDQLRSQRSGIYWKFFEQQRMKEELENYQNELSRLY